MPINIGTSIVFNALIDSNTSLPVPSLMLSSVSLGVMHTLILVGIISLIVPPLTIPSDIKGAFRGRGALN